MNKKNKSNNSLLIKWPSLLGFGISIILLTLAIVLSMNEEQAKQGTIYNKEYTQTTDMNIVSASINLNKNINAIKSDNLVKEELKIAEETINENEENTVETTIEINPDQEEINSVTKEKTEEITEQKEETNSKFIMPVDGEILKNFSMDSLVYSDTLQEWVTHRGMDIKAEKSTVVKAIADGKIQSIKEDPRFGLSIIIEHSNGFKSVYSSLLSSEFVKEGEEVKQGQSIGTVGNTAVFEVADGAHLHFELLKDNSYVNPELYINM